MKPFAYITLLCVFCLAACRKDYTCMCNVGANYANSKPDRVVIMKDVRKSTARANCVSTIQTYSETCVLKD